jgi:hypothetical protein
MGGTLHASDPDPVMLSFKPPPTFETPDGAMTAAEVAARVGGIAITSRTSDPNPLGIVLTEEVREGEYLGTNARISLVNAPKWDAVAERARKAGIEPDWSLCGALWLALDKFERSEQARKAEFEKRCKAVAREARTGTKLGEARKEITRLAAEYEGALQAAGVFCEDLRLCQTWLKEQAADIDPDLRVAELDEAQLRGVVGVELLRLRRELAEARAEAEAERVRIGEVVAERAALRRELAARAASTGPAFVTVDALAAAFDQRADGEPDPEPAILARVDWAANQLVDTDPTGRILRDAATALRHTMAVAARFKRLARVGGNLPDSSLEVARQPSAMPDSDDPAMVSQHIRRSIAALKDAFGSAPEEQRAVASDAAHLLHELSGWLLL